MIANASFPKDRALDQTASLQSASALNDLPFSMITPSREHEALAHRELRGLESSYNCGWETADECGWYSIDTDQAVWKRGQGKTGPQAYGPSSAADGSFFIYSECALKNGKTFTYQLNLGSRLSISSVSFQYFLYGRGFQDVQFLYSTDSVSWTSIWQKTAQTQSSQADSWLSATLDVSGSYPQYFRFSNAQPSVKGGTKDERDAAFDTFSLQYSPSLVPTSALTTGPTLEPVVFSTNQPTFLLTPSLVPAPTVKPTLVPSPFPTTVPSEIPSTTPLPLTSILPTQRPSALPSVPLSSFPSFLPTQMPTMLPSPHPSSLPSSLPFMLPSRSPSLLPSALPSSLPSMLPSGSPSDLQGAW